MSTIYHTILKSTGMWMCRTRNKRVKYLILMTLAVAIVWTTYTFLGPTSIEMTSFSERSLVAREQGVLQSTAVPHINDATINNPSSKTNNIAESAQPAAVCSSVNLHNSHNHIFQTTIDAWHTFIPRQSHMINSSCWYITNLIYPLSPPSLEGQLTSWVNLQHIERRFTEENALHIIRSAFPSSGQQLTGEFDTDDKSGSPLQYFCMPTVYLAGFPKCGTTYLYNLIATHPSMRSPAMKEGQFWRSFVSNASTSLIYQQLQVLHYISHFKSAAMEMLTRRSHLTNYFTIDASASTIFESAKWFDDYENDSCVIPTLLSTLLPKTKFIVVMRHPIDRLWSDYWFFCSMKWPHDHDMKIVRPAFTPAEVFHNHTLRAVSDFEDCIGEGKSELHCLSLTRGRACKTGRVSLSLYYLHLVRWLSVFPRKQFLFLKMEDFSVDIYSVMKQVWSFLEVEPMERDHFHKTMNDLHLSENTNENKWIKSDDYKQDFKMWNETRTMLNRFFRPFNQRLAQLLHDNRFLWDNN